MRLKVRPWLLTVHQWLGVLLGAMLVVISVSGSIAVFFEEITHTLHADLFINQPRGKALPPEQAIAVLQQQFPTRQLMGLSIPDENNLNYFGVYSEGSSFRIAFFNPYSSKVVAEKPISELFIGIVILLHTQLLAGPAGANVVGVLSVLFFVLIASGVWLWPGWRTPAQSFRFRMGSPARLVHYDLHKIGGIVTALFLAVIALTGAAMAFHAPVEELLYRLSGIPKPTVPVSTVRAGVKALPLGELLTRARAVLPEGRLTNISPPAGPTGTLNVRLELPGEKLHGGHSGVWVDQYSGAVLRVDNAQKGPLPQWILDWLLPFHTGEFAGMPGKIAYAIIGLVPVALFWTGFALWLDRLKKSLRKQQAAQSFGL